MSLHTVQDYRRLDQFRPSCVRVIENQFRACLTLAAWFPSTRRSFEANRVDGQIAVRIDVQAEKVFPILDRKRREGFIGVAAEEIHGYQQVEAHDE